MYQNSKRIKLGLNIAIVIVAVVIAFIHLGIDPVRLAVAGPLFLQHLATNFFPPSLEHIRIYVDATLHTVAFAVVGTFISAIFSFFFALLMAKGIMPYRIVRLCARFIMTFTRSIPVVIWVAILVFIFGIGSMVGLVALIISITGFLSRSYAESLDEIAAKKLEPLRANGATPLQILIHGILPEFAPAWVNWTLFTFEISIRASAILGMVGAGGMGVLVQINLEWRNFDEVATIIILLIAIVLCAEVFSGMIRKRLI